MSRQLSFVFQELPLVIENGFSAGLVNGSALVNYWTDGTWGISQIYLDGAKRKGTPEVIAAVLAKVPNFKCWDERDILLDRGDRLNAIIWDRLENEWRGQVQDAVNFAVDEERIGQLEAAQ